jgi:hypothetical protein
MDIGYEPEHTPILLGLILYLSHSNFQLVKNEMVTFARQIEEEERLYVYHPNYNKIQPQASRAIAAIANYKVVPITVHAAIRKTLKVMEEEDFDIERHIFVIMDQVPPQLELIDLILNRNKPDLFRQFANYHFLGVGNCGDPNLPGYEHHAPQTLQKKMLSYFKKAPCSFLLNNYQPLNLEQIKKEYQERYGRKHNE